MPIMSRRRILGIAFSSIIFGLPYILVLKNYFNFWLALVVGLLWGWLATWVILRVTKE
jgi:hypothetical protein